jgi:hypothetical protein
MLPVTHSLKNYVLKTALSQSVLGAKVTTANETLSLLKSTSCWRLFLTELTPPVSGWASLQTGTHGQAVYWEILAASVSERK